MAYNFQLALNEWSSTFNLYVFGKAKLQLVIGAILRAFWPELLWCWTYEHDLAGAGLQLVNVQTDSS